MSKASVDFILDKKTYLRGLYSARNAEFDTLRRVFDGNFAGIQQQAALGANLFQDRIKIVYNIINATVRRYMDSLSSPPRIEATPRGLDEADTKLADARSKWLTCVWIENSMALKIIMSGFYQSLLDKAVWHVRPDPDMKYKVRIDLAIPDNFMPMPGGEDWLKWPYIIYAFKRVSDKDMFLDPMGKSTVFFDDVVEYWDRDEFVRIEDNKEKTRIQTGLHSIPWAMSHNIPIPHRHRGQGDCDQAVGLNEYLNLLFSDEADIINYAANPITVLRGSKAGAQNLTFAPRAIWEMERDGQAQFLQWAGSPPTVEAQILRTIQAIEDQTGVSSPAFGREMPSGTSGSAMRSILAGFNTRIGTKQQLLGEALSEVNVFCQLIAEKVFPGEEFEVIGESKSGSQVGYKFKPSEFKGWYGNKIIFEPADPTAKFFQEMEKMNGRIQSRFTTMKNLGITNPSDEIQRMAVEAADDAMRMNNQALGQAGRLPPQGFPGASTPLPATGVPLGEPGKAPDPTSLAPSRGQAPDLRERSNETQDFINQMLGGMPPRGGPFTPQGETEVAGAEGGDIQAGEVQKRLRSVALSGRAYIVGDLASKGAGKGIEIQYDNPQDQEAILKALGSLAPLAKVKNVGGAPAGPSISIGGGRDARRSLR